MPRKVDSRSYISAQFFIGVSEIEKSPVVLSKTPTFMVSLLSPESDFDSLLIAESQPVIPKTIAAAKTKDNNFFLIYASIPALYFVQIIFFLLNTF